MIAIPIVRWMVLSAILLLAPGLAVGQTVRAASGADFVNITPTRDQFRTDLGGGTVAGANGSFGGLRREINWDGVPATAAAPNLMPGNFFNTTSPRGVIFSTPGTGFQVSSATADAGAGQPAPADFGNIDAAYTATFRPFTAQRLFTPLGSNITDVTFFLPGTSTPARTNGFGAVFSDVDLLNTSSIQFFDGANVSLGTFSVPFTLGNETFSFVGVSFPGAVVARVRITSGNTAPAADATDQNGATRDVVVMDDFIYGEPRVADLTLSNTHSGNFSRGNTGATYTIKVVNVGGGATDGSLVTVIDTLPVGLTATALSGTGWTCVLGTLTCTRTGVLGAGLGFPAITLTVSVAANAPGLLVNSATVSGGGGDANPANNTVSDSTSTVPASPAVRYLLLE